MAEPVRRDYGPRGCAESSATFAAVVAALAAAVFIGLIAALVVAGVGLSLVVGLIVWRARQEVLAVADAELELTMTDPYDRVGVELRALRTYWGDWS